MSEKECFTPDCKTEVDEDAMFCGLCMPYSPTCKDCGGYKEAWRIGIKVCDCPKPNNEIKAEEIATLIQNLYGDTSDSKNEKIAELVKAYGKQCYMDGIHAGHRACKEALIEAQNINQTRTQ